jgi:hypothetical protein
LRPTPQLKRPYPDLSHLAAAVLHRAYCEATPEVDRGGKNGPDGATKYPNSVLIAQCEALLWLSSADPDLLYWMQFIDRSVGELHAIYRPMLMKFIVAHPTIAAKFALPGWTRASA